MELPLSLSRPAIDNQLLTNIGLSIYIYTHIIIKEGANTVGHQELLGPQSISSAPSLDSDS